MKKLLILVFLVLFSVSCDKDQITDKPIPQPTQVEQWEINAGYPNLLLTAQDMLLKAKGGNNPSVDNGIRIIWDDTDPLYQGNGTSPDGPITLENWESMQLGIQWLEDDTIGTPSVNWYTNDQQIVQAYWDGHIQARWIDYWFFPKYGHHYPNVTVITAVVYRRNPKYNGHNQQWLEPYQDNIIVYVTTP